MDQPSCSKKLILIRHGETVHNVAYKTAGKFVRKQKMLEWTYFDSCLTQKGKNQAESIQYLLLDEATPEVIWCSPLTRTIETAMIVFPDSEVHIVEDIREVSSGFPCDKRRPVVELKEKFPHLTFDHISPEDQIFLFQEQEQKENIEKRISNICEKLKNCKETCIVIVSHNHFLTAFQQKLIDEWGHPDPGKLHLKNGEIATYEVDFTKKRTEEPKLD